MIESVLIAAADADLLDSIQDGLQDFAALEFAKSAGRVVPALLSVNVKVLILEAGWPRDDASRILVTDVQGRTNAHIIVVARRDKRQKLSLYENLPDITYLVHDHNFSKNITGIVNFLIGRFTRPVTGDEGESVSENTEYLSHYQADVNEKIKLVAARNTQVLIIGETGTGKTEIARRIHSLSNQNEKPFVHINCPSIPETLLESELFGYEKGAFTGATATKRGKIETAGKGTVFLDEIGDISDALQAKLLKVLDEHTFHPLGSLKELPVRGRIITATNRDLKAAVDEQKFRRDLYYRLNTFVIHIRPVREFPGEIVAFFKFFLKRQAEKERIPVPEVSEAAEKLLVNYQWPGNLREIENLAEQMNVMGYATIGTEQLAEQLAGDEIKAVLNIENGPLSMRQMSEFYALQVYEKNGKNQVKTAEALEIDRKTLRNLLKKARSER
jgi:DNA-binding NtrC family response regulator